MKRPKKGFSVPYFRWLRGDLRGLLDEFLSPVRIRRQGIWDPPFVQRSAKGISAGQQQIEYQNLEFADVSDVAKSLATGGLGLGDNGSFRKHDALDCPRPFTGYGTFKTK